MGHDAYDEAVKNRKVNDPCLTMPPPKARKSGRSRNKKLLRLNGDLAAANAECSFLRQRIMDIRDALWSGDWNTESGKKIDTIIARALEGPQLDQEDEK